MNTYVLSHVDQVRGEHSSEPLLDLLPLLVHLVLQHLISSVRRVRSNDEVTSHNHLSDPVTHFVNFFTEKLMKNGLVKHIHSRDTYSVAVLILKLDLVKHASELV